MSYKKAEEILPKELLEQVQEYVDGQNLYIPRKSGHKKAWGCGTTYRDELHQRNRRIRDEHRAGLTARQLAKKYHLSEKSISRILRERDI